MALRVLYDNIDREMAKQVKQSGSPLACSKGCSACCHGMQVTVHLVEACEMVHAVAAKYGVAHLQSIVPTLVQEARELANPLVDSGAWQDKWLPCPLLDGPLCSIYEARPSKCRAWVSLDDPAKCNTRRARIRTLDHNWTVEKLSGIYAQAADDNGFPDSAGPLQFQMLLALLLAGMGPKAYRKKVRGTTLGDPWLSCIPWLHLERGNDKDWRGLQIQGEREVKKRGMRLVSPLEVLEWRELRQAIDGLGNAQVAGQPAG